MPRKYQWTTISSLIKSRKDPRFHAVCTKILKLPSKCCIRNLDLSDQAMLSNLLFSNFGKSVQTVASVSCLTGSEMLFCIPCRVRGGYLSYYFLPINPKQCCHSSLISNTNKALTTCDIASQLNNICSPF